MSEKISLDSSDMEKVYTIISRGRCLSSPGQVMGSEDDGQLHHPKDGLLRNRTKFCEVHHWRI